MTPAYKKKGTTHRSFLTEIHSQKSSCHSRVKMVTKYAPREA